MKNEYYYKGFDVRQDGKNFDVRRHYKSGKQTVETFNWRQAVRNAESIDQAVAQLDNFIAAKK
jgi:hypothetical protein